MELSELQALIPEFEKLKTKITALKSTGTNVAGYLKQYEPKGHDSVDKTKRPDKTITIGEGESEKVKTVEVTRLAIPVQKQIVGLAAIFLCGNPIQLAATPVEQVETDLLTVITKTWKKNKLDYESKKLLKIMMSETEVAEIWWAEKADDFYWANTPNEGRPLRLRMKVLANSLGDSLYPVFNSFGDMIAFGREYTEKVDEKDVFHFDVYTDTTNYLAVKTAAGWEVKPESNPFKKIPVIYYSQPAPEWEDVQTLIDRFEKTLSNHGDTNDYFGSPMVFVEGEIEGFAEKGEQGKVLQGKNGAKASYMSWDQSPKSMELEFKNLRSLIFDMTNTPDISFENMKGLGTFSGIALKMLFFGAHMKASEKEENFGKGIQRRINFLSQAMAILNMEKFKAATGLDITPRFEYYLPKNDAEIIDMLVSATSGKPVMSVKQAVSRNPLVDNVEAELQNLKEESTIEAQQLP